MSRAFYATDVSNQLNGYIWHVMHSMHTTVPAEFVEDFVQKRSAENSDWVYGEFPDCVQRHTKPCKRRYFPVTNASLFFSGSEQWFREESPGAVTPAPWAHIPLVAAASPPSIPLA